MFCLLHKGDVVVPMISHAVGVQLLTSSPHKGGTEHARFSPDQPRNQSPICGGEKPIPYCTLFRRIGWLAGGWVSRRATTDSQWRRPYPLELYDVHLVFRVNLVHAAVGRQIPFVLSHTVAIAARTTYPY